MAEGEVAPTKSRDIWYDVVNATSNRRTAARTQASFITAMQRSFPLIPAEDLLFRDAGKAFYYIIINGHGTTELELVLNCENLSQQI